MKTQPTERSDFPTPAASRSPARLPILAGLFCLGAAFLCSGCSMLSYTSSTGEHFSRFNLGTKTAIAALNVEAGTNGIRRFELQGYQNDSTQALGTVTEAAVRAAIGAPR